MFGGHGLFAPNGGMFAAIVDGGRIAIKLADPAEAAEFQEEGGRPWVYDGRSTMSGWYVAPDALYDDPGRLEAWARRAHAKAAPSRPKKGKSPARSKKAASGKRSGKRRARG